MPVIDLKSKIQIGYSLGTLPGGSSTYKQADLFSSRWWIHVHSKDIEEITKSKTSLILINISLWHLYRLPIRIALGTLKNVVIPRGANGAIWVIEVTFLAILCPMSASHSTLPTLIIGRLYRCRWEVSIIVMKVDILFSDLLAACAI